MNKRNPWLVVATVTGFLAVAFGAFGAHGIEQAIKGWYGPDDLKPITETASNSGSASTADFPPGWYRLDQLHQQKLKTWITGVRYHFYHALAILAVGLLWENRGYRSRKLNAAGTLFVLGILGFSGSIYVLVVTKISVLGMTAAFGGTLLLFGWILLLLAVISGPSSKNNGNNS